MQHYICLQPTGTRTRSCYVIKDRYPESVCTVCVAQPPGFGNDWLNIGEPTWRRRAELLSPSVDGITDYSQQSHTLSSLSATESKFERTKFGSVVCSIYRSLLLMWACDYVQYAFSVFVAAVCVTACGWVNSQSLSTLLNLYPIKISRVSKNKTQGNICKTLILQIANQVHG